MASKAWVAGLVVACAAGGCLFGPSVRPDIAIIEGGDATIYRIDKAWLQKPGSGSFELQPGGHTVDVTASAAKPVPFGAMIHESGLTSLCVKARGGHRYRIKARVRDDQIQVFIVDAATGEPPKTPCGPDEDE